MDVRPVQTIIALNLLMVLFLIGPVIAKSFKNKILNILLFTSIITFVSLTIWVCLSYYNPCMETKAEQIFLVQVSKKPNGFFEPYIFRNNNIYQKLNTIDFPIKEGQEIKIISKRNNSFGLVWETEESIIYSESKK